jgi:hypothetical protein
MPNHTWEDNIKMDLQETGREDVAWIHLGQGQVVGCSEHGNETSGSIKFTKFGG